MFLRLSEKLEISRTFIKAFGLRAFIRRASFAVWTRPFRRYLLGSYSQDREDIIVDALLDRKRNGFFVDVGANDPVRSNNTVRFYKRGWTGINIEPNTDCFRRINAARPRDINLNIGISREGGTSTFYSFLPDTRSTFSRATAERLTGKGLRMAGSHDIALLPLAEVLERYCGGKAIDFMSVDTEGYDEQVLLSNDWERFRPTVICIESGGNETIHRILTGNGYRMEASTSDNVIYKLEAG
jgi:FkbM family methyltransferase